MEAELISHLLVLSERFGAARDLKESTIGRMAAADGSFFARLRAGNTITIKKYDAVVVWFDQNWPVGTEWPAEVKRPRAKTTESVPPSPRRSGARTPSRVPAAVRGAA